MADRFPAPDTVQGRTAAAATAGRSLSDLAAEMPSYPTTPELRAPCPEELKFKIVDEVRDYFRASYKVIDIDGARVVFPDGWGLIRASNTQAVLVLRFEAKTQQRLAEIRRLFYDRLARYPEVELPD